jgi:hypothetical protein
MIFSSSLVCHLRSHFLSELSQYRMTNASHRTTINLYHALLSSLGHEKGLSRHQMSERQGIVYEYGSRGQIVTNEVYNHS